MIKKPEEGYDRYVNMVVIFMKRTCDPQETEKLASFKTVEKVLGLSEVEINEAWNEAKKRMTTN